MALKITDFKKNEPPFGLEEEAFIRQEEIIDITINIRGILFFENQKNEAGVYVLFTFPGEETKHYTTSHAGGVMRSLNYPELIEALEKGEVLEATLNVRPSKQDKTKTVWEFI